MFGLLGLATQLMMQYMRLVLWLAYVVYVRFWPIGIGLLAASPFMGTAFFWPVAVSVAGGIYVYKYWDEIKEEVDRIRGGGSNNDAGTDQ
jgi:hypothetical protein